MKAYSNTVILSLKTYKNKLKFNFLMRGGHRNIDYSGKYSEEVIYRNEGVVIQSKKQPLNQ